METLLSQGEGFNHVSRNKLLTLELVEIPLEAIGNVS